eukprot:1158503-Pelagomonas_calceolata.AAC.1
MACCASRIETTRVYKGNFNIRMTSAGQRSQSKPSKALCSYETFEQAVRSGGAIPIKKIVMQT